MQTNFSPVPQEHPPLGKFFIQSYDAGHEEFPIVATSKDPRAGGYRLPEELSFCPDTRYPDHRFVGATLPGDDQRVLWLYRLLPGPWVPFTRYDDNLGPVQGRRRSVVNTEQDASLTATTKTTYDSQDGDHTISWEIEETWSDGTGSAGNPAYPITVTDFYDNERGAVHQVAQLVTDIASAGTLTASGGTATLTRYEPFNQFLRKKIIETFAQDGPVLTGQRNNRRLGIIEPFTKRLVIADSADGDADTTISPVSIAQDEAVTETIPTAALTAFNATFPDYANIPLPDVLTAIAVTWELPEGTGAYIENGAMICSGDSINLNLSLSGSGEASAACVPEIIPTYAPSKGEHVPVTDVFFFLPQPVTHAAVLAKLLTLSALTVAVTNITAGLVASASHTLSDGQPFQFRTLVSASGANLAVSTTYYARDIVAGVSFKYALTSGGAAVTTGAATSGTAIPVTLAWPNFQPIGETLILKGQQVSINIRASARGAVSVNANGDYSMSVGNGLGGHKNTAPSIRAVVLKPAIHAAISLTGGTTNSATADASATATIPASGSFDPYGDGSPVEASLSEDMDAIGSVSPSSLSATPVTSIPTAGLYMLSAQSDLSEFSGWSLFRCRLVDFANV